MRLTGKGLADFAFSKLGVPYVYGAKGADGKFTKQRLDWLAKNYPNVFSPNYIKKAMDKVGLICCDCSGLISWYTGKIYGSSQLYSVAKVRGKIADVHKDAPIGAVLWRSGHVAVYIGNGYCVEEKGIDHGCVRTKISNTRFTHYLLFDFIDYENVTIPEVKKVNPYKEPSTTIRYKDKGNDVKWVQWECVEAGYFISIDGDFGNATREAVKSFQQSCKIQVDGLIGPTTRKCFKND